MVPAKTTDSRKASSVSFANLLMNAGVEVCVSWPGTSCSHTVCPGHRSCKKMPISGAGGSKPDCSRKRSMAPQAHALKQLSPVSIAFNISKVGAYDPSTVTWFEAGSRYAWSIDVTLANKPNPAVTSVHNMLLRVLDL